MEDLQFLEDHAVNAAINYDWDEAINLNKKILKLDKTNLPANLRLGFAFLHTQKYEDAKKYYHKALKIQPNSVVARENLERIAILESKNIKKSKKSFINLNPDLFLEIPGKTKNVVLVNPGQKHTLAQLSVGQEVIIKPKNRKVEVRSKDNDYIGSLPDDLSRRLLVFLKAKSIYTIFIKEANLNRVTVFITEQKKGRKVQHYLSFPHNVNDQIKTMNSEKDSDDDNEESDEVDLEKLAESLAADDKEYLPYVSDSENDEEDEE